MSAKRSAAAGFIDPDLPYTIEGAARAIGMSPRSFRQYFVDSDLLDTAPFGTCHLFMGYQLIPIIERNLQCREKEAPAEETSLSKSSPRKAARASSSAGKIQRHDDGER
jgi:hypothetical protein